MISAALKRWLKFLGGFVGWFTQQRDSPLH